MSRLLLDTHALLWWATDDDRLSTSARDAIIASDVVYASDATLWELCVKSSTGKLRLSPNAATWFDRQLRLSRIARLSLRARAGRRQWVRLQRSAHLTSLTVMTKATARAISSSL